MARNRRRNPSRRSRHQLQRGQVLIIVVFAITALVAFVGLVIDLGLVFIQYGRLRRSVDAAALSASLQYRENYTLDSLTLAAEEFLRLNGINDPAAVITVCDVNGDGDADDTGEELALCDENGDGYILSEDGELRKFVHVVASSNVRLAFLPVIGIRTVHLAAEAISEAASLDVVLLIDRSESMTFDASLFPADDPMRDPRQCNAVDAGGGWVGACSPFDDVKHAAYDFVNDYLFFPYDRVAIITFDRHVHDGDDETVPGVMHLSNDENAILTNIKQLTVYDPQWNYPDDATLSADPDSAYLGGCEFYYDVDGPCRYYDAGTLQFVALDCKSLHDGDPAPCTTTNTGGGLYYAGGEFARTGSRPEALWVTILISDGLANSSIDIGSSDSNVHCPGSTHTPPYCHDGDTSVRHCQNISGNEYCLSQTGSVLDAVEDDGVNDYDTDDFARDMADFVGIGQQSLIFTIGLGPLVSNCTSCPDSDAGQKLLEYAAKVGNGVYFEAPSGDDLQEIFREIADKIAVRLTH